MPLYSDLGLYYGSHLTTPSYYSSPFLGSSSRSTSSLGLGLLPVPRLLPSRVTPSYSPLLPSIPESSGYGAARRVLPSLDRTASPRSPTHYITPKPLHIDTADIDVSASRFGQRRERPDVVLGLEPGRQATIKRGRTVVRLHTKKVKENPTLDTRRRMTPGEKLVQKFLILDKAEEEAKAARRKRLEEQEERERIEGEVTRLQALAAKKAAADASAGESAHDGTFAQDPDAVPPTQNFPMIQGLTENAALDILLSTTEDDEEEEMKGGQITRTESTGTVKKRKIKEKDGTVKAAKKKTKKKELLDTTADDSPATGDEMVEKSMLQRRNTIRFRRNSQDVDGFPEIEVIPGSRRSSFDLTPCSRRSSVDQSPSSRRSSVDSTGEEVPLSSENKSTVKRRKGPKHKIIADVSVDNSSPEPRSPKFVVDEVKVEQSPASPRGVPKKFRYEVIVEDVEGENAPARRGKAGKENKTETASKKKKTKATAAKTLADRQDKSVPKSTAEVKAAKKESIPESFQKSRPEPAEETKAQVAVSKTEEVAGKLKQQKGTDKVTQKIVPPMSVTQEKNKDEKNNLTSSTLTQMSENKLQDTNIEQKEKAKLKDRKPLEDLKIPKLSPNELQNGLVATEKVKPPLVASAVPKMEEAKVGKRVLEKTKANKHQADPTPPPTPTTETPDSGINFWAFLNGSEDEKEVKKPAITDVKPLPQSHIDKTEKAKGKKPKPALQLKLEDKCTPAEILPKVEGKYFKAKTSGTEPSKGDDKILKTEEDKTTKHFRKTENLIKDGRVDVCQGTVPDVLQNQSNSAFSKASHQPQSESFTQKITTKETDSIASKQMTATSTQKVPEKVELSAKTPDEKVPKWKGFAKDRTKTSETSNTAEPTGKSELKGKQGGDSSLLNSRVDVSKLSETPSLVKDTSMFPVKHKDEHAQKVESTQLDNAAAVSKCNAQSQGTKTNEMLKEIAETIPTVSKLPETPEKKPPPKWKGLGMQTPTPTSPKESSGSPKTSEGQQQKKYDVRLKSKTSLENLESKDIANLESIPQQKESEPLNKKLLKTQDSKESKYTNKINAPEDEAKPVPKWKLKATADKDEELKKTPLAKVKQPTDKFPCPVADTPEPTSQMPSSLDKSKTLFPGTPTLIKEKNLEDSAKSSTACNSEPTIRKTALKTPNDDEKLLKKPLLKQVAVEEQENEQTKIGSLVTSVGTAISKTVDEVDSKKDSTLENNITIGKPNLEELKSKEDQKEVRVPFDKKGKLIDQKSQDKKDEEKQATPPLKKGVKLGIQRSEEEHKGETLPGKKGKLVEKSKDSESDKSEPTTPVKKFAKFGGQKSKDEEQSLPPSPLKKEAPQITQKSKEEVSVPVSPVKKGAKLAEQKSEEEKSELPSLLKKEVKIVTQKSKEDENVEIPSPVKKGAKLVAQKSKEDEKTEPTKKVGKLGAQKIKEDEEKVELTKKVGKLAGQKSKEEEEKVELTKKVGKLPAQKSKEEEGKVEPTKKVGKLPAQKSKEEEEKVEPTKKVGKLPAQKSKEEEGKVEPTKKVGKLPAQKSKEEEGKVDPTKKVGKLPAQKNKEEEEKTEPPSPTKKEAKPLAQKSKEDEKKEPSPTKKGVKLMAQKSKEDEKSETPPIAKKIPAFGKAQVKGAEKAEAGDAAKRKAEAVQRPAAPAPAAAPESGSDADSEESSSEDEGDTTPRASSSSCSSSDSGFDSRPSSVPVPSTASDASSREPGTPSLALLACSPSLDPYSEDAGLPRGAAPTGRSTPPASSLPRFRKYTVDDFQFLKLLGKGSFGKVLLAELRGTDRHYAVKCLKKDVVLEDDDVECTLIERKVLALGTKHPYLCHLFCTFQTESHLLFVMEYLNGGDLMFHIQQSGRFPENRARFYAAEIICGLRFLHKKGIVYRDLKLDNILLDYEGHVRIADFGMCKLQIFLDRTADTFCGTPDYMAPEIIKGLKYNQCVDWWSFGVLVFEMLVGVSPFSGCDEDELFWSICNEQPQYPRFLSREAHSLLCSLLEKDAAKRLGTPESPKGDVPDHIFFRNMDWDALERRELEPPFRPRLKHPLDVQYFDAAFTAERAELTPVDASILQSMDQAQFQGFSYTNPNATD